MFCTRCGAPLDEGENFCTNCGAPVERPEATGKQPEPSGEQPVVPPESPVIPVEHREAPVYPPHPSYPPQPMPQPASPKRSSGKVAAIVAGAVAAVVVVAVVLLVVDPFRIMPGHGDGAATSASTATENANDSGDAASSHDAVAPSSRDDGAAATDASGNGDTADQGPSTDAGATDATVEELDEGVARSATVETGGAISGDTWSAGPEIGFSITGSSVLADDYGVYPYDNAKDRVLSTAWVEGASNAGEGQSISLTFAQPEDVAGIAILSGYHKSEDIYYKNARPKEITLLTHGEVICSVVLSDAYHQPQTIRFDKPVETDEITVQIDSVYPGSKYADCAISEVAVIPA